MKKRKNVKVGAKRRIDRDKVRSLRKKNLTMANIAALMKISIGSVFDILHE